MAKFIYLIYTALLFQLTQGLYIRPLNGQKKNNAVISDSEWNIFKAKLGLTDNKIKILKTQKDQKGTVELLKRFMKDYSKQATVQTEEFKSDAFHDLYKDMLKKLQAEKGSLKASLNFELAEKSPKNLKRSRRKIAFKMVSDIPSERIGDLLKIFSEQYGLNDDEPNEDKSEWEEDYNKRTSLTPTDSEFEYENLFEDEEVPNTADTLSSSSQMGSFQDLIIQASRQQWQQKSKSGSVNIDSHRRSFKCP